MGRRETPRRLPEHLRLSRSRWQEISPLKHNLLLNGYTSAGVCRIFRSGAAFGFGREWIHPEYIHVLNRGESHEKTALNRTFTGYHGQLALFQSHVRSGSRWHAAPGPPGPVGGLRGSPGRPPGRGGGQPLPPDPGENPQAPEMPTATLDLEPTLMSQVIRGTRQPVAEYRCVESREEP